MSKTMVEVIEEIKGLIRVYRRRGEELDWETASRIVMGAPAPVTITSLVLLEDDDESTSD